MYLSLKLLFSPNPLKLRAKIINETTVTMIATIYNNVSYPDLTKLLYNVISALLASTSELVKFTSGLPSRGTPNR